MPNTILTPNQITREALRILHQKLNFVGNINRQYDDSFAKDGAKIGDTLRIRLPNRYTVRTGANLSVQDTIDTQVSLQVANQRGVDLTFSSAELTLSLDDFSQRILKPAMSVLAASIESDALSMYGDIYQLVGSPGTVPNSLLTYLQANARLDNSLVPHDGRNINVDPLAQITIVDALKGLFNDTKPLAQQYREGVMGRTAGFDWYTNTLMPTHTNGTTVTGLSVSGASQTGSNLVIGGTANGNTFRRGTTFQIANVFEVHPETKVVTNRLQTFVITSDVTATATTTTIPISPAITTSGGSQNVNGSPANSAAITVNTGAASTGYLQSLAYYPDAFTFATADLIMPQGVDFASRQVLDGISMRIVRQYAISSDTLPCRIDVLYGYKTIRPEMAVRVTS